MKKYIIGISLAVIATASIGVYAYSGSGISNMQSVPTTLSCPSGKHVYSMNQGCVGGGSSGVTCYVTNIACS